MDRRTFMSVTAAGAAMLGAPAAKAQEKTARLSFELRRYEVATPEQKQAVASFYRDAAIPALNRLGIEPVGLFGLETDAQPEYVYALLPHAPIEKIRTLQQALLNDLDYTKAGAAFLDAPADQPAFVRVESMLLHAFEGMPGIAVPTTAPGRVFQLRVYQSPSIRAGQKKIEMFNVKEIEIFNKVGLAPVFFGEAIAGPAMPNLTYMLGFDDAGEMDAAWKRFLADPDWLELKAVPEYADKLLLSKIENLVLKPLPGSQI